MKQRCAFGLYSLLHGSLWAVYGVLLTYANRYLLNVGLNNMKVGILLGMATALSFVLQPVLTALTDRRRMSVRGVICLCAIVMFLATAALLLPAKALWVTVALFAAACIALQILPAFCNALGMAGIRSGLKINFGISRGVGSVTFAISARLTNLAIEQWGLNFVPLLSACLTLLLLPAVLFFPRSQAREEVKEKEETMGGWQFLRSDLRFLVMLVAAVLLCTSHNMLTNCMFQIAEYKGDADAQGTAVMISALVELPTMFLFGYMLRKARCDTWFKMSGVFFFLRAGLSLVLPGIGGLYAAQTVQIFGFALYTVSSVYYVGSTVSKANVVKGQTYLGAACTVGTLLANFGAGAAIDAWGVQVMLILATSLAALGAIMLFFCTRRVEKTVGTAA